MHWVMIRVIGQVIRRAMGEIYGGNELGNEAGNWAADQTGNGGVGKNQAVVVDAGYAAEYYIEGQV